MINPFLYQDIVCYFMHRKLVAVFIAMITIVMIISTVHASMIPQVSVPSISVTNGAVTSDDNSRASTGFYKPPCVGCVPTPIPTSTPIPPTQVNVDFIVPSKVRQNVPFTVTGVQIDGVPFSDTAKWSWFYKSSINTYTSGSGKSFTITPKFRDVFPISLNVVDSSTNSYGKVSKVTTVK